MKKNINFSKFKKIILVILCSITLFFSMPVKSKADFWESLVDVVLKLPDAVMRILNNQISGQPVTKFKINLNLKGWDDETRGSIYNFDVTPYDIFTSGLEAEYTDRDGNVTGTYTKIPLLDINFFDKDNENVPKDSANILRPVIANIYKSLRNLVLVLMMVILLYVGIRIIVSTAVTDQVKYKQWLMDWVVGICLLLLMQYIMSFLMNVNEIVLEMLGDNKEASYYISLSKLGGGIDLSENSWGSVSDKATKGNSDYEASYEYFFNKHLDIANSNGGGDINSNGNYNFDGNTGTINVDSRSDWGENGNVFINARIFRFATENNTAIIWGTGIVTGLLTMNPFYGAAAAWGVSATLEDDDAAWADKTVYRCNLMEYIRTITTFGSKYVYIYTGSGSYSSFTNSEEVDKGDSVFMGYAVLYLLLVIETCMFLYTYIKRVFKLAFYTMIAPLIAFMYPIDKLGDGKAQAFNTWFKEYLFNILIQPLHLLLYTVFIFAAMELMQESIIYAIGAYAYMIAAEKFFKKIFGFDKAPGGGPGALGSPMAGGMAMRGLDKLTGSGPHAKGAGKSDGKDSNHRKIKFAKNGPPSSSGTPSSSGGSGVPGGIGGSGSSGWSGVPSGSGGSRVPGASGSSGTPGTSGGRMSGMGAGLVNTLGNRSARFLTAGRGSNWSEVNGRNVIRGIGDRSKRAGKFLGKKAFQLTGSALGAVGGMAAGAVMGMAASAFTGEDKMADAMQKGALGGSVVGGVLGGKAFGKVEDIWNDSKAYAASKDGGGNVELAANMQMDDFRENNKDYYNTLTADQKEEIMDGFRYGAKIKDQTDAEQFLSARDAGIDVYEAANMASTEEDMGSPYGSTYRDFVESNTDINEANDTQRGEAEAEAKKQHQKAIKEQESLIRKMQKDQLEEMANARAAHEDLGRVRDRQTDEMNRAKRELRRLNASSYSQKDYESILMQKVVNDKIKKQQNYHEKKL